MATWDEVASPGTDPALLERVVGRLLGPHGDVRTVAREAVTRCVDEGLATGELLPRLAPVLRRDARAVAAQVAATWVQLGVRAALVGDPGYPVRLAAGWPASGAPVLVAWRATAEGPVPDRPAVAVVGARRATSYGTGVAAWLAAAAGEAGALVVSGGAVGIDAAAHAAALDTRGATAVILGCGHDVAYPRAHARPGGLFDRVHAAGGWLVSELLPGTPPRPANVLARNRIVAGMVDVVVVVEGSERSGSLRTATAAAERGISVLAVPGDVRAPGSAAPHRLLAEGAAPCTRPDDLLALLEVAWESGSGSTDGERLSALPGPVLQELERRWPRPVRLHELAQASGVAAGALLAAVTRARVAGEVAEGADGIRLTRAPSA